MLLRPLTTNERAETPGFTHVAILTANDLTTTTNATAQTFTLAAILKGDVILRAFGSPVVPFQKAGDVTYNDTQVSLGDGGSATRHLAATQSNQNGAFTPVLGNTPFLYAANDSLILTVAAMTGRNVNELNRGEYHVFIAWFRSSYVSNAIARTSPSKG